MDRRTSDLGASAPWRGVPKLWWAMIQSRSRMRLACLKEDHEMFQGETLWVPMAVSLEKQTPCGNLPCFIDLIVHVGDRKPVLSS